jgi:hypothetical protein
LSAEPRQAPLRGNLLNGLGTLQQKGKTKTAEKSRKRPESEPIQFGSFRPFSAVFASELFTA